MKWLYSISTGDSIVRSDSIGGSDDFINIIHLVKLFDLAAYYLRADVDGRAKGQLMGVPVAYHVTYVR